MAGGAQGWRSRSQIAIALAVQTDYTVNVGTISTYAVNVLSKLSAAVNAVSPGETLPLLERRRNIGYRLAEGVQIEIIVGSCEETSGCA